MEHRDLTQSNLAEHLSEMKGLKWKDVFASLNPSAVFEVVAMLAEELAMNGEESVQKRLMAQTILQCRARGRHARR